MREEISEPQHWRAKNQHGTQRNNSWTSRRRSHSRAQLAADAVDAAIEEVVTEPTAEEQLDSSDIIASLAKQLELLENQREQIQRLLDQAQGS